MSGNKEKEREENIKEIQRNIDVAAIVPLEKKKEMQKLVQKPQSMEMEQ